MACVPSVGKGIIDIWSWSLDRSIPEVSRLWDTLSPEETLRATRFVRERDAIRFSTARGLMRMVLSQYLGVQASAVILVTNTHGKPQIGPSMQVPLQFNLSHSADRAVLAVCDMFPIGIDIEQIRPINEDVAGRFFSRRECAAIKGLQQQDYLHAFYRCWTRKEAFVKAHGMGLLLPLDSFDVTVEDKLPPRLERLDGDEQASESWKLFNVDAPPGFVGAVAAMTGGEAVRLRYQSLARIFIQDAGLVT
ncbi:4'-phosphopantetheinyl transferase superfamily protein [Rhizobium sp. TH2]|uniref:4'-phosphopantetheinyl transferase family protein n=1 Tax=Rhizobium sp. TH2 TaxID=2775403 RepID=UPI0021580779|nr:4'-phosphopantetheinyl transferase superfamily protein [Rhizobium sp. TH2]UVC07737.1 4'-phosphopantetheinyl transferase superfamily protein [Rhizobium sp. TH2]